MNNLNIKQYQQNQLFHYQGGEHTALKRLKYYLEESHHISRYKETRNQLMGNDYSSRFSAWLSQGCISPRRIYEQIKNYESEHIKNVSKANLESKGKTVECYTLNGNFIKDFPCLREAKIWLLKEKSIYSPNIDKQIKDCCNGRQKTCHGFKFKYK